MTRPEEDQQEVIVIPVVQVCVLVQQLAELDNGRLPDLGRFAELLLRQGLHLCVQGTGVQCERCFRHSERKQGDKVIRGVEYVELNGGKFWVAQEIVHLLIIISVPFGYGHCHWHGHWRLEGVTTTVKSNHDLNLLPSTRSDKESRNSSITD